MKSKLTKVEAQYNHDLQWLKRKGYLSERGIEFADAYNDYCNLWKGVMKNEKEII